MAGACSNRGASVTDSAATDSIVAPVAQPRWLVATDDDSAVIGRNTTRDDLLRKFGAANVRDDVIQVGEGDTKPGTVIYPDDTTRRFEITWKDSTRSGALESLRLTGSTSNWKVAPGISLGASLKQLEQMNGRPFTLTGFNWDYAGTVTSWNGGKLEELSNATPRIYVRLMPESNPDSPNTDNARVMGDRDFSSNIGPMQRLDPRVYQILVMFNQPGGS